MTAANKLMLWAGLAVAAHMLFAMVCFAVLLIAFGA